MAPARVCVGVPGGLVHVVYIYYGWIGGGGTGMG